MEELLKRLVETPGPSGREEQVRNLIAREVRAFCREVGEDPLGNLVTAGGIPEGSICFPRRYSHSPVEMSDLKYIEGGLKLLVAFIKSLDEEPIKFGRGRKY